MGLRDFKMPKLKFKKMKINIPEEIENVDLNKLEDREKLKEKIESSRESIEQGTVERNIADSIRKDDGDDGR